MDILVTHAPLHGYGDMTDLPHRGFTAFSTLLDRYHPQYMLHGHIHLNYGASIPREHTYGTTRIVNCFERVYLDVDAPAPSPGTACLPGCWATISRAAIGRPPGCRTVPGRAMLAPTFQTFSLQGELFL